MIKLTRGALTMLLAQYRGILKNAWIKNFAVAALATTVTAANAAPVEVETWQDAVAPGAPALDGVNGVLNLQTSHVYEGTNNILVITGGTEHKIGSSNQSTNINFDADNDDTYVTSGISINATKSNAQLTIESNSSGNKTTGVNLYKVEVKGTDTNTATLTIKNQPYWFNNGQGYQGDESDYTQPEQMTIGKNGKVEVIDGELDVNEQLTIEEGGELTSNRHLWMGRGDDEGDVATKVTVNGKLTSTGALYLDSSRLTVGKNGEVKVQGNLGLDDLDAVNINKLTTGDAAKIKLTGATSISGSKLVLDKKNENVVGLVAGELTLGSSEYDNSGMGLDLEGVGSSYGQQSSVIVTTKLTTQAKNGAYQIKDNESFCLDTSLSTPAADVENESDVGSVVGDLEVDGGSLYVHKGKWNAEGLKVTEGSVSNNASLTLKTLQVTASNSSGSGNTWNSFGFGGIYNNGSIKVAENAEISTSNFSNHGTLDVGGDLTVNGKTDAESVLYNAGTISANSLTLKGMDYDEKESGDENYPALFQVADGKFNIKGAVTTKSDLQILADATVNANSIEGHTIDIYGKVGSESNHVASITATDEFTVRGGSVFADSISANLVELDDSYGGNSILNVGNVSTKNFNQKAGKVTVTDGSFKVTDKATVKDLTLAGKTEANVGSLDASNGSVVIGENASLTVNDSLTNNADKTGITVNGTLATTSDVLGLTKTDTDDAFSVTNTFADSSLNGVLKITNASEVIGDKITADNLALLKNAISDGDEKANFTGKLELTGVQADIGEGATTDDAKKGSYTQDAVNGFASLVGDVLSDATIDVKDGQTEVSGDYGNLIADKDTTSIKIQDATLKGTGSEATKGNYISAVDSNDDNKVVVAGAQLGESSSLTLAGKGNIGSITADGDGKGTLAVTGDANVVATDGAAADIGTAEANIAQVKVTGSLNAKDIFTKALETSGEVNAKEIFTEALKTSGDVIADKIETAKAEITAGIVKVKEAVLAGETAIKGGASLVAEKVDALTHNILVGQDGEAGSTGYFFANKLASAGKLVVDPEFNQGAAIAGVNAFNGDNKLSSDIVVGKNAIFAYDESLTEDQLKDLTSKYKLSDDDTGYGSALVVNSAIDLQGTNKGIYVGKDASSSPAPKTNTLTLGQNGAVGIGGSALENAKVNEAGTQVAAINVEEVKYADSSKILLDCSVQKGERYQIFNDDAKITSGGSTEGLQVKSLSNYYTGTIGTDGKTSAIETNDLAFNQLTTPVKSYMEEALAQGGNDAGIKFLRKAVADSLDGGREIETVARLGAFGGLYNAAFNVNKSSTEVIAARTSMGNHGVQQVASNNDAVGGAVWLSPIYKNVKADSLESNGKESGSDVKLTGIALGADVTTSNNLRLGAMFNLGSGDTDGNKLGKLAENDFDYFGLGAYAGYSFGNFAIAGDVTYSQVDNDLSATSSLGYGKFNSSVDTNVFSLGITAKYTFDTNFATITPHAGIRYTSLDADSLDVKSANGVIAKTSYDKANVVSFPVGVTFTKDIKVNAWKLQPTFDVTLTANTGDTKAEYDTYFVGADSKVKLESEFTDSVTYGLTAGFEAQHESGVALGLGVNYEGSSNTNSYGVSGNVRYSF